MKNKILSGFFGILTLMFSWLTYNQYVKMQSSTELYRELGSSIPSEFNMSVIMMFTFTVITLFLTIKFLKKAN